jgi:hypothetical protein
MYAWILGSWFRHMVAGNGGVRADVCTVDEDGIGLSRRSAAFADMILAFVHWTEARGQRDPKRRMGKWMTGDVRSQRV